jgi:hypothetical protein
MFEIIIFCVILLAISYWAVLWLMGRREDVLHGEFVDAGAQAEEPVRSAFPDRPPSPKRAVRPIFPEPPAQTAVPEPPARAAAPEQPAFRPERLESLLNSIKQDLNQLVQK